MGRLEGFFCVHIVTLLSFIIYCYAATSATSTDRLSEMSGTELPVLSSKAVLYKLHYDGPLPIHHQTSEQYKKVTTNKFTLSSEQGNNCFSIAGEIALVRNVR